QLYQRYKDRVFSLAYRITGNANDALDAAQESFVILYQRLGSFSFEAKFSSWFYRTVVNASIDLLRRSRSRRPRLEISLDGETGDQLCLVDESCPAPDESAEKNEFSRQVQASLLKLSPKLRIITVLRYLQDMSYEELAEILGISLGTVKSRLARAHIALAEHLSELLDSTEPDRRNSHAL
ncbi:MAG: RNA polymerase sigma factor, partial [Planctomycetota bacterium]